MNEAPLKQDTMSASVVEAPASIVVIFAAAAQLKWPDSNVGPILGIGCPVGLI